MMEVNEEKESNYQRIKVLKEGGFGKAYLAEDLANQDYCVIKETKTQTMKKSEIDDIIKEAEILKVLVHPNIIRFRDIYTNPKQKLCIVMDYADAGDLSAKIENAKGYFPEHEILDMFTQLCLAVKHIHDRKIIHRDLKSQNVFLNKLGVIKLGDFGISEILNHTFDLLTSFVGTWYYISPEIVKGHHYSFKTDIWSLGVILYEMCCLKLPFKAQNQFILQKKIQECKYNPIPDRYSQDLKLLVERLLVVDPSNRPSITQILSMSIIKNRIKHFLSEQAIEDEFSHTVLHNHNVMKPNLRVASPNVLKNQPKLQNQRNYKSSNVLPPHRMKRDNIEANVGVSNLVNNLEFAKRPDAGNQYKDRLNELRQAGAGAARLIQDNFNHRYGSEGGLVSNRNASAVHIGMAPKPNPQNNHLLNPLDQYRRNDLGLRNNIERGRGFKSPSPEVNRAGRPVEGERQSVGGGKFFGRVENLYGKLNEVKKRDLGVNFDLEEKLKEVDMMNEDRPKQRSHVKEEVILNKYRSDINELRQQYREAYDIKPADYRLEDERIAEMRFHEKEAGPMVPISENSENEENCHSSRSILLNKALREDRVLEFSDFLSEVIGDIYGEKSLDKRNLRKRLDEESARTTLTNIEDIYKNETNGVEPALLLLLACSSV